MIANKRSSERGQAIVFILVLIFVIFGFAALAVDGAQTFAERRRAQNAADAAALAAAFKGVDGATQTQIETEGYTRAAKNGFNNDHTTNTVTINHPPASGQYAGKEDYYQAVITSRIPVSFAQFIYKNGLEVTTEAIARGKTAGSVSSGNTLHSLSLDGDSMDFSGNVGIVVDGGNIFSNGGMTKNGASGGITVKKGQVDCAGSFSGKTSPFNPAPVCGSDNGIYPESVPDIPQPYCPNSNTTINGVHYYVWNGNPDSSLQPGIHCLKNGISKGKYSGSGVLLVLLNGGIKMTGNDGFDLTRSSNIIDANGNQYGGMLFYVPKSNTEELKFGGNQNTKISGTIYAPGALCDIAGTSDLAGLRTNMVCWKIRVHGNPDIYLTYKEPENYRMPPIVELTN